MDAQVQPKQVISNVVNMDIRSASQERIARIKRIDNVVNLIYSPETAVYLTQLSIANIVNAIEAPAQARAHHGHLILNHDTLRSAEPLSLIVFGQITVNDELTEDEIEQGVEYLAVLGQVLCPEHLAAALRAKLGYLRGPLHVYPRGVELVAGSLTLDERLLRSMKDGSQLMVTGRLKAPQVLPNDLVAQKIQKIQVTNGVLCREENAATLLPRLESKSGQVRTTVIPSGFELVERPLVLNASLLKALPARRLYCTETVQIGADVDTDTLDGALDALIVKGQTICPAALSGVLATKLNVLDAEVIFYEGTLWIVQGNGELSAARVSSLEGKLTVVVRGRLTIAPDVDPGVLADLLDKVYNYGAIRGTPEQVAVLQFRLGADEGHMQNWSPETEVQKAEPQASADEYVIDNIVNLDL
jgi:hypothetical protein